MRTVGILLALATAWNVSYSAAAHPCPVHEGSAAHGEPSAAHAEGLEHRHGEHSDHPGSTVPPEQGDHECDCGGDCSPAPAGLAALAPSSSIPTIGSPARVTFPGGEPLVSVPNDWILPPAIGPPAS